MQDIERNKLPESFLQNGFITLNKEDLFMFSYFLGLWQAKYLLTLRIYWFVSPVGMYYVPLNLKSPHKIIHAFRLNINKFAQILFRYKHNQMTVLNKSYELNLRSWEQFYFDVSKSYFWAYHKNTFMYWLF